MVDQPTTTQHQSMPDTTSRSTDRRQVNVGEAERWLSMIGGGALMIYGLRRSFGSLMLALGGGALLYRGLTGHCSVYDAIGINTADPSANAGVTVEAAVTVNKPLSEVYRFYRNLENHPRFVSHLESVQTIGGNRSHWVAKAPLERSIEWDAEIVEEQENALISWRSLPGADIDNAGTVRFQELSNGRGVEVQVKLDYTPPVGAAGSGLAKLLNTLTTAQLREDLRHFKQLLEAGERPTTTDQPAGRPV
jgi:uncharacterized membrane protein